jgi:alpha-beta hydrolase superfamily lysophospholipase
MKIKNIMNIAVILLIFYLVFLITIYFMQDRMLYFPDREILITPRDIGLEYEEVSLKTRDNVTISGWYIPSENEKGVLLFCHGNAGNISHRMDSIRIFHGLGFSVLIFDYRGYGHSEGKPSEKGTYLDAEAAWNYLIVEKQKSPDRIILFGRSLGAAIAAESARRHYPAGIILESSFISVPEMGTHYYPWIPVRLLSKFDYTTIDKIKSITCPKLIIHSPDDEIVPFEHGRRLFENAGQSKEFLQIKGSHNEGFLTSGNLYIEGLESFCRRCLHEK